jgi:hypothetical protein
LVTEAGAASAQQYTSDLRSSSVHALHQEAGAGPRPCLEREPSENEAGPHSHPKTGYSSAYEESQESAMGAGAAHLAYSYSPTMGHGVPRPAPKADSPTALFRAHLERHRDPGGGSLLRLEDLLGVPLSLRLCQVIGPLAPYSQIRLSRLPI